MTMPPADFQYISNVLKQRSGLALTEDKTYLIETRLQPIARAYGCKDVAQLIQLLKTCANEKTVAEIVEAMTTNESSFFRDGKPFEHFRNHIAARAKTSGALFKKLRIWSAACSTGQEPYTLAMSIEEERANLAGWQFEIFATDIAQKVLDKAKTGIYSQFEVQRGMPTRLLLKHFMQTDPTHWQVKEPLRQMVKYQYYNLLDKSPSVGMFDIIFCRNVLIYFDEPTKTGVLDYLAGRLNPGGLLYLGSTESVLGLTSRFHTFDATPGVYAPAA